VSEIPGREINNDIQGKEVNTYEVEDLALLNENVKRVHDLLDRRRVVPPMHVENVNICCTQLVERASTET